MRINWLTYRKVRLLVTLLLLLVISGGILYTLLYGFNVERIEFQGEGMQAEFNDRLISGNSIFFPSAKVKQDLLHQYPQLKDVIITKQFPHTIVIKPVLRQPFAQLVTAKATYGIDEDGHVVGVSGEESLPQLFIDEPSVRVGSVLSDPKIQSSLQFLKKSKAILAVSAIRGDDSGSLRAISGTTELLFTQNQNIDTVMATLQTLITGVRIKGTMPKIIDVRYTKPIITF